MHFILYCVDKPGHAQVRADTRNDHVAFLTAHRRQIVTAGPTLNDAGDGMTGSLLIVDFPDRAAAEAFAANDPYAKAGLFDSVTIKRWKMFFAPE